MAIKGKIKLDWEIAEDGMSFFVTGTAIEQDGTVKEAECEVSIDDAAEAYDLGEALYEIAHEIFEDDIEKASNTGTLNNPENKRLKQLNLCDEYLDEDDDQELIEALFDMDTYNDFIEDYNNALDEDWDSDEDDED